MSSTETAGSHDGISLEERAEIVEHIDGIMAETRVDLSAGTAAYAPRGRGALLPLIVNLSVLIVFLLAGVLISRSLNQREQTIAEQGGTVQSTESKLISALRVESDRLLREKDRTILDAQQKLTALSQQEGDLRGQSDAAVKSREQELEAALQQKVAAEKALLARAELSASAQSARLRQFEAAQRQETARQRAALRQQAKAELALKLKAITEQASQAQQDLDAARQERIRLQGEYGQKESDLRQELAQVKQASTAEAAAAQQELARLREQRDKAQMVLEASSVASEQESQKLQDALSRLSQAEAELAVLRADAKRRQAIAAGLEAFREQLPGSAQPGASYPDAGTLARLLQAKILVRQILDAEPVRSQYPSLRADLERYYDALEQQGTAEGRASAFKDLAAVFDALGTADPSGAAAALPGPGPDDSFAALVQRLEDLLGGK